MPQEPLSPESSSIASAYFAVDPTLSVYQKSHIRSMLIQFFLFFIAFLFIILPYIANKTSQSTKSLLKSPYTPATFLVTIIAVTPVPPFGMDGPHWAHWIGPANALLNNQWPYFDVFSYYGFMPIVMLTGWLSAFGLTPISMACFISMLAFLSALFSYVLIVRQSHSHQAAFIGTSILILFCYNSQQALMTPNHSALRFHFFVAASLLVTSELFSSLKQKTKKSYVLATLLGLLSTWEPSGGFFVLLGFSLVLLTILLTHTNPPKKKLFFLFTTYIAGILILPIAAILSRHSFSGTIESVKIVIDFLSIFPQGYGNLPQYFDPSVFLSFLIIFTLLIWILRPLLLKRPVAPDIAFCMFALCFCIPYLLQAFSRGPVTPNGFIWILLPSFTIILSKKFLSGRQYFPVTRITSALIGLCIIFSIGNPITILADRLRTIIAGQEGPIFTWSQNCASRKAKGEFCPSVQPFTLKGLYEKEASFNFPHASHFSRMVDECKKGTTIVDALDFFVYENGKCYPEHQYPVFFSISTKKQENEYLKILLNKDKVFFGSGYFSFQDRMKEQLKEKWIAQRQAPSRCNIEKKESVTFVASSLSDQTRSKGVSLTENPNIFLDIDRDILCYLSPGMRLKFSHSGERTIIAINGDFIQLSGKALDPIKDGYPNPIRIIRRLNEGVFLHSSRPGKYKLAQALTNNNQISQKFTIKAQGLSAIKVKTVTYGTKPDNYLIRWKLSEIRNNSKKITVSEGYFNSTSATDWGNQRLILPPNIDSRDKTYEISFYSETNGNKLNYIGLPLYSLEPSIRPLVQPVTLSTNNLPEPLSLDLEFEYTGAP